MKRLALTLVELLIIVAVIGLLIALLLPNVRTSREAARRNACMNNLKQLALGLHHYEEAHGALPPAHNTGADGKSLHSWRTQILPYMELRTLYETIDLAKPWDDAANAFAFKTNVLSYQCPSAPWVHDHRTTYQAVITSHSCLREREPRTRAEIKDDPRHTILAIEVDEEHMAPWMSLVDADEMVVISLGHEESTLAHIGGFPAAFVDGSVNFLSKDMAAPERQTLISIAGNDGDEDVD